MVVCDPSRCAAAQWRRSHSIGQKGLGNDRGKNAGPSHYPGSGLRRSRQVPGGDDHGPESIVFSKIIACRGRCQVKPGFVNVVPSQSPVPRRPPRKLEILRHGAPSSTLRWVEIDLTLSNIVQGPRTRKRLNHRRAVEPPDHGVQPTDDPPSNSGMLKAVSVKTNWGNKSKLLEGIGIT